MAVELLDSAEDAPPACADANADSADEDEAEAKGGGAGPKTVGAAEEDEDEVETCEAETVDGASSDAADAADEELLPAPPFALLSDATFGEGGVDILGLFLGVESYRILPSPPKRSQIPAASK